MQIQTVLRSAFHKKPGIPSIFMLARNDFEKLKAQIIQFISEAHKTIEVSPSEDVYSLCIDAFAVEH